MKWNQAELDRVDEQLPAFAKRALDAKKKALAQGHDPKNYADRMTQHGEKPWIGGSSVDYNDNPLSLEEVFEAIRREAEK